LTRFFNRAGEAVGEHHIRPELPVGERLEHNVLQPPCENGARFRNRKCDERTAA
jgi:hypothetical protein